MAYTSKTTAGAASRNVGDTIVSTVYVSGETMGEPIFVSDPVPASPSGITRSWVMSIISGGVSPMPPLTGMGAISHTYTIGGPGSIVEYVISDTVPNVGTYQNTVNVTSMAGASPTASGQSITVGAAAPAQVTVVKSTEAGPFNPGDSITSTVTITNISGLGIGGVIVSDPLPAGAVSRTFSTTYTGTVSGQTVSGTGAITDTLGMMPLSQIVYTIIDVAGEEGIYENVVTVVDANSNSIEATGGGEVIGPVEPPASESPTPVTEEDRKCQVVLSQLCRQTDVEVMCDLTNPASITQILFVTVVSADGDVIPTNSTEFPAPAGAGVFSTIGYYRSYYASLAGVLLSPQPTTVGICPGGVTPVVPSQVTTTQDLVTKAFGFFTAAFQTMSLVNVSTSKTIFVWNDTNAIMLFNWDNGVATDHIIPIAAARTLRVQAGATQLYGKYNTVPTVGNVYFEVRN